MKTTKKTPAKTDVASADTNLKMFEAQMKVWADKIEHQTRGLDAMGAEARIEHRQTIDDLKIKRAVAQEKIDGFKKSGSDKWDEFKSNIDDAWKDLEVAFKGLKS